MTYDLAYTVPTGTLENLELTDFLPLPVFDATDGGSSTAFTFNNITSSAAPAAYNAQFGPRINTRVSSRRAWDTLHRPYPHRRTAPTEPSLFSRKTCKIPRS